LTFLLFVRKHFEPAGPKLGEGLGQGHKSSAEAAKVHGGAKHVKNMI
jgi:hypothetical protein